MKFSRQLVMGSLAVLVLSACSSNPSSRRQAEDSFDYTSAQLTQGWEVLPTARRQYYRQYQIPQGEYQGEIGEGVDIRPPQQILELIPGARYTAIEGGVIVWPPSSQEADDLWNTIGQMIDKRGIELRQDTPVTRETDWIDLTAEDEPNPIASRYMIERVNQGPRLGIMVSLSEFRKDGEVVPLTRELSDRYSRNMINYITSQYDTQRREI
ncbi:MAG: outer membrane protein assembly factor BamC, partial [Vibrio sp.]